MIVPQGILLQLFNLNFVSLRYTLKVSCAYVWFGQKVGVLP